MSSNSKLPPLLPGVSESYVIERLSKAAGKELSSGKFMSERSSSFLAVNTFAWFHDRPECPPAFDLKTVSWPPNTVEVEHTVRFPWAGGTHPWLDAFIETASDIVGIESKRFEPYDSKGEPKFSPRYDKDEWHDRMGPFVRMKDSLKSGEISFTHLDATQLVKHAFGLITEGRRKAKRPYLIYLFAEPEQHSTKWSAHRSEINVFADAVRDAEVGFSWTSYRDWLDAWPPDAAVQEHRENILKKFTP
jgi:hypothetical protein